MSTKGLGTEVVDVDLEMQALQMERDLIKAGLLHPAPELRRKNNLTSLTEQIRVSLLAYGCLYPSMWEVLNQWFLVIGNGYAWKKGALVSEDRYDPMYQAARVLVRGNRIPRWPRPGLDTYDCVGPEAGEPRHWYPMCEYSLALTIPADARPEWRRCLHGFLGWLLKNLPEGHQNLPWVRKALNRMDRQDRRKQK